jgi:hypothetical protein
MGLPEIEGLRLLDVFGGSTLVNPKAEIRSPKEGRNPKAETASVLATTGAE